MKSVYAVATMDTKSQEIQFVADRIKDCGVDVVTVDIGTGRPPGIEPDIPRSVVAACHKDASDVLAHDDRGEAVAAMGEALAEFLAREYAAGKISGVIGAGGSGGTSIVAKGMRALPIGLPKIIVSTVASGNTAPYVDFSDITMMYSVVDVAGVNIVSRKILGNAAHAIAGMVEYKTPSSGEGKAIGLTMFGVTTPCVDGVRLALEAQGETCLVFHATGSGGRALESLVKAGMIDRVIDLTTTEVADEIVGGVFNCGEARFDSIVEQNVPCVMSLGALDMANFGGISTVPQKFEGRILYEHNPEVTLLRTNAEECAAIGKWMADKINRTTAPFVLVIPEGGVSMIDAPGQPFYDPQVDRVLFETLEKHINQSASRRIVRSPNNINDHEFIRTILSEFERVCAA